LPTSEILESKFICYGKKNSIRDSEIEGDIQTSQEDDTKCLILMVDENRIQNGEDIKFIHSITIWMINFNLFNGFTIPGFIVRMSLWIVILTSHVFQRSLPVIIF